MRHGRHIKILGRGASPALRSPEAVCTTIKLLVEAAGLRLLGIPHIYEIEPELAKLGCKIFEDESGIVGIAALSTSHIAVHTWPLREWLVVDVFSCRVFDYKDVERVVIQQLGGYNVQTTDLSSTLDYPDDW